VVARRLHRRGLLLHEIAALTPLPLHVAIPASPDLAAVWRTRARLLAAVPQLRAASVTEVAARLGYASPAAFTAAFSRTFVAPPSRFTRR
jgi:AraC-like DNA-binding protein